MSVRLFADSEIATIAINYSAENPQHTADKLKRDNTRAYNKRYARRERIAHCDMSKAYLSKDYILLFDMACMLEYNIESVRLINTIKSFFAKKVK